MPTDLLHPYKCRKTIAALFFATGILLSGCSGGGDVSVPADVLVTVGTEHLRAADLRGVVPAGLSDADSTAFARSYIRAWIETRLIASKAAAMVDMDEIERLTSDYRSELIMSAYRRAMATQASDSPFAEDSIRAFYNSHESEFRLERPMLKGVYLKIPDDAPALRQIRRWYKSEKEADLDRLEKAAAASAVHYDYFRDTWIDLQQLETRIPYNFEAMINTRETPRPIDITVDGFTYLLSVSDWLPAGATMPYEAAAPLIRERLLALRRLDYDRRLRESLFNTSINDGTITFPNSNPLK